MLDTLGPPLADSSPEGAKVISRGRKPPETMPEPVHIAPEGRKKGEVMDNHFGVLSPFQGCGPSTPGLQGLTPLANNFRPFRAEAGRICHPAKWWCLGRQSLREEKRAVMVGAEVGVRE